MADQATMTASTISDGAMGASRSASGVVHDLMLLTELQGELCAADFRRSKPELIAAAVWFVLGSMIVMASCCVAMIGLAYGFVALGLAPAAAYLVAAVTGLTAAAIVLRLGWERLRRGCRVFRRSQEEFVNNVNWLKMAVRSRPPSEAVH
jgi:hypothetical protein